MPIEVIITETDSELQTLIAKVKNAPDLAQMVLVALQVAYMFAVKLVEAELAERADRRCHWPRCPKCNARIKNKGKLARQIKSLIGIIRWKRKVGRCPNGCEIGQLAPMDKELGLEPNQRVSNEVKRVACALAVFLPYTIASAVLQMITGVKVSHWSIWQWVQQAGQRAAQKLQMELDALNTGELPQRESIEPEIARLPMIIGADGVKVPFRPNGGSPSGKIKWREIRIGIVARLKRFIKLDGEETTKIERKRVVGVLGNVEDLRDRLWLESCKQGVLTAFPVIWLSDGGPGFWRIFREKFSFAQGILDFYHAAQNIWKAAKTWLDGRTQKAREWFNAVRHILRHGKPSQAVNEINKPLREETNLSDDARKSLENLLSYLCNHYQSIEYSRYKDLGYPLGSGVVESTCKWLVQQRFKCVGMRWSEDGFNNLFNLRILWVNGRFDSLFFIPP